MAISKDEFRQVMGCFATGVTVITTHLNGQYYGMTANAVTSVALEPMLFLVCVDRAAATHEALSRSGVFAASILRGDQEHLSRLFASRREGDQTQFQGVTYHLSESGCPILEGCLAYLDCRVTATCPGGDHTIFLGEVQGAGLYEGGTPLIFYRSRYAGLQPG